MLCLGLWRYKRLELQHDLAGTITLEQFRWQSPVDRFKMSLSSRESPHRTVPCSSVLAPVGVLYTPSQARVRNAKSLR